MGKSSKARRLRRDIVDEGVFILFHTCLVPIDSVPETHKVYIISLSLSSPLCLDDREAHSWGGDSSVTFAVVWHSTHHTWNQFSDWFVTSLGTWAGICLGKYALLTFFGFLISTSVNSKIASCPIFHRRMAEGGCNFWCCCGNRQGVSRERKKNIASRIEISAPVNVPVAFQHEDILLRLTSGRTKSLPRNIGYVQSSDSGFSEVGRIFKNSGPTWRFLSSLGGRLFLVKCTLVR